MNRTFPFMENTISSNPGLVPIASIYPAVGWFANAGILLNRDVHGIGSDNPLASDKDGMN